MFGLDALCVLEASLSIAAMFVWRSKMYLLAFRVWATCQALKTPDGKYLNRQIVVHIKRQITPFAVNSTDCNR